MNKIRLFWRTHNGEYNLPRKVKMTPQEELDQLCIRLSRNHAKLSGQVDTLVIPAPPLQGEWRYDNLFLCCGTVRIAHIDIDTNPSPEFIKELFDWICTRLNKKQV